MLAFREIETCELPTNHAATNALTVDHDRINSHRLYHIKKNKKNSILSNVPNLRTTLELIHQ